MNFHIYLSYLFHKDHRTQLIILINHHPHQPSPSSTILLINHNPHHASSSSSCIIFINHNPHHASSSSCIIVKTGVGEGILRPYFFDINGHLPPLPHIVENSVFFNPYLNRIINPQDFSQEKFEICFPIFFNQTKKGMKKLRLKAIFCTQIR